MIDELPDAPDPAADAPTEFNAKAAAFVLAQKAMVPQVNTAIGAMSAFAAGGAYAFQYTFDSATADADPGHGRLRLGSSTQSAASTLRIDAQAVGDVNIDNLLAAIGAGTSVLKGAIRIVEVGAPGNWMLFDILAITAASGFRNMTVVPRASSSVNPFGNGAPVMIFIDRAGDVGNGAEVLLGGADITEPTALINFLNIFSPLYDNYRVEINGLVHGQAVLRLRAAVAGAVSSASSYIDFAGNNGDGSSLVNTWSLTNITTTAATVALEFANVNSITTPKVVKAAGGLVPPGSPQTYRPILAVGHFVASQAISGFQLSLSVGSFNFTGGKIMVFGRKN